MRKDKTLKRLAEEHFFLGRALNFKESTLLQRSNYSNIVKENVNSISESHDSDSESSETKKRKHYSHPGLNRKEIEDLIDDVELEFNLDLSNPSPFKYKKIDPTKLKDYIRKYISSYFQDEDTLNHVTKIINRDDLNGVGILYRLYSAAGV